MYEIVKTSRVATISQGLQLRKPYFWSYIAWKYGHEMPNENSYTCFSQIFVIKNEDRTPLFYGLPVNVRKKTGMFTNSVHYNNLFVQVVRQLLRINLEHLL